MNKIAHIEYISHGNYYKKYGFLFVSTSQKSFDKPKK
jgi:hypothetical protein